MNVESIKQWHNIVGLAAKQRGKRAIYVCNGLDGSVSDDEILQTVCHQVEMLMGREWFSDKLEVFLMCGMLFFDSEEDQYSFYRIFKHPLVDSSAFYAATYDENGNPEDENT